MDEVLLHALRDPAGIPTHPVVFLVLGVLTFALHIFAVQLMLGAAGLTLYGAFNNQGHWRRLSLAMLDVAKISVSVAIVIGVAPLLFVQVIYDPFWYTSNVLSAQWVIGFIVLLTIAYWLMYRFYFRNKKKEREGPLQSRWTMVLSLLLFLTVGFIMHVLTYQMLFPEQWMDWYAPNGQLDTSGSGMHAFNLWRFLFFISLSLPVAGSWLVAYRRYCSVREDADMDYLQWCEVLGIRLLQYGSVISLVLGLLWMMTLPEKVNSFAMSTWVWVSVIALAALPTITTFIRQRLPGLAYLPISLALVVGIIIAASREALRYTMLHGIHQYNLFDYKLNIDWYSTVLFFVTFAVIGGMTLAYLITVAWRAGQTDGVYTPGPIVRRMGNITIALIVVWMVQYFAIGFYVWAR